MNRGYVKMWRKAIDSPIFGHDGMWKLFCLCLLKATHEPIELHMSGLVKPIKLTPGQFVTGRFALWEDYHQINLKKRKPARKPSPSAYSLFRWLLTLQEMQMLSIKSCNKYSIITILNWERYQQNAQQVSNKRSSSEHKQEQYKKESSPAEISEKIRALKSRYNPELIDRIFQALASTRKSGKMANTIILSQLEKWATYPPTQVEAGIRTYLEKGYSAQDKNEKYLLGIIRNSRPALLPSEAATPDWY